MTPPPPSRSARTTLLGLIGWVALCYAVAGIGGLASVDAARFYNGLSRPAWAPPAWLFGPAWALLFTLMALAAWRVWRRAGFAAGGPALLLFIAQLLPNAAWSWLFFAAHTGPYSTLDISILWLMIAATLGAFARIERRAAWLLVPYLLWVSFAFALNVAVWRLNPGTL